MPQIIKGVSSYQVLVILSLILMSVGAVQLVASITPVVNDDAFVYYTYARNMTEGRPFAYDVRNIPSEGFTSLLYLLLLTPFEFLKVNMPFASILINLVATLGLVLTAGKVVRVSKILTKEGTLIFMALFWLCLVNDVNVGKSLGLGLETMLGPLAVIAAALPLAYFSADRQQDLAASAFFVTVFLAYITRPENGIFVALIGGPLLLTSGIPWHQLIKKTLIFGLFLLVYLGFKYMIFGDLMPTGYYRKIGGTEGAEYVKNWRLDYDGTFNILKIVLIPNLICIVALRRWFLLRYQWLWFLIGVTTATLFFFTKTTPLVGTGYRFLMTPIVLLYLAISLLLLRLLESVLTKEYMRRLPHLALLLTLLVVTRTNFLTTRTSKNLVDVLNIYSRATEATNAHKYLQLGYYLHDATPHPEQITLVFGDAGAVPYSFGGRFIDSNGLTEPELAHLFQDPDGPRKTQAYIDYVLSQYPDIIVLAFGIIEADGTWTPPANIHSPFRQSTPLQLYKAYKDYGIVYICSLRLYYDLHIGLWAQSPQYDALQTAFLTYCNGNGYILENGITITNGEDSVHFSESTASMPLAATDGSPAAADPTNSAYRPAQPDR